MTERDVMDVINEAKFGRVSAYEVERVFVAFMNPPIPPERKTKTKWKTFGGPLFLILVEK